MYKRQVINDNYIDIDDNKHLPVVSVSVLVTADDYSDKNRNDLIVTNDTEGDLTIPDVDMTYDKINKRFDISDRKLDDQNAKLDDMINEMKNQYFIKI